jgi:hypothetical protein
MREVTERRDETIEAFDETISRPEGVEPDHA